MTTAEQLESLDGQIEKLTGDAASLLARLSILHARRSALVLCVPQPPAGMSAPALAPTNLTPAPSDLAAPGPMMANSDGASTEVDEGDLDRMNRSDAVEAVLSDLEFGIGQPEVVALLREAGRTDTSRQVSAALNHLKHSERVSRLPNGEWAIRRLEIQAGIGP